MTDTAKLRIELKANIPDKLKNTLPKLDPEIYERLKESYGSRKTHANMDSITLYADTDSAKCKMASPYGIMVTRSKEVIYGKTSL